MKRNRGGGAGNFLSLKGYLMKREDVKSSHRNEDRESTGKMVLKIRHVLRI